MKKNKIIQVPMSEDLLAELDALSKKQDRSRASLIREAAAEYLTRTEEAEKERQYIEGLEKHGDDYEEWGEIQIANLPEDMEPEDFSDWRK
jgi:metal-responsive CopG/Arc/MetJ family transcriptional regulator